MSRNGESALDVLRARGFVQDVSDEDDLRKLLETERVTFYYGVDPTSSSMHLGHLIGCMAMSWLQRDGHRPIALAGGATGRVGDPSFRDAERPLLDDDTIEANLSGIRAQLSRFIDLSSRERGLLVDNHDWFADVRLLDFLREVGKHFSVNAMMARDSVRRRLESREQGISFTEFSYQLLQAYDFAHLHQAEGCRLQIGGSDQWGNITAGIDLTRRLHGAEVYGLVWPLRVETTGKKMSKTEGKAIWLDPAMTSPYAYYQSWINVHDDDVERDLKTFTFLDLEEIDEVVREHAADPGRRLGQRRLAEEATRLVHGEEGLADAERATAALFGEEPFSGLDDTTLQDAFAAAPSAELPRDRLVRGVGLLEVMVEAGAAQSNGEARRLVEQGGVYLNNARIDDPGKSLTPADLAGQSIVVIRVGKKRHFLVRFDSPAG
jgi:tyrosyl-tRNA synthetase